MTTLKIDQSEQTELFSKYTVGKLISCGSYGSVYDGEDSITRKKVAIKKITNIVDLFDMKSILREIALLRMLNAHPKIVHLAFVATSTKKTSTQFNSIYLVFDRYDSDLLRIISSKQTLTPAHHQYILYQIFCALYYMHSAKVAHRDLKPQNILINTNCDIVICDLGMARATQITVETTAASTNVKPFKQLTQYVVTRFYRSPEIILGYLKEILATDLWSVGCIFAEMLLRRPLFRGRTSIEQLNLIHQCIGIPSRDDCAWVPAHLFITGYPGKPQQPLDKIFSQIDSMMLDLLKALLKFNPSERMTAEQALEHPFIRACSSYKSEDIVTFSLKDCLQRDKDLVNHYYRIETELDDSPQDRSITKIFSDTCTIITQDATQYTSASVLTPSSTTDVRDSIASTLSNHNFFATKKSSPTPLAQSPMHPQPSTLITPEAKIAEMPPQVSSAHTPHHGSSTTTIPETEEKHSGSPNIIEDYFFIPSSPTKPSMQRPKAMRHEGEYPEKRCTMS